VSAALVLGGVDATGPHIYSVYPHGSTDKLPYATMGSGSLCAMAVFESRYKEDMEEQEAIDLVSDAIQAGIFNDLGSGGNVDVCVIRPNNDVSYLRSYVKPNDRIFRSQTGYVYPRGSTQVISETKQTTVPRRAFVVTESTVVNTSSGEAMSM
jgi:20S proteasome subunit beta 2